MIQIMSIDHVYVAQQNLAKAQDTLIMCALGDNTLMKARERRFSIAKHSIHLQSDPPEPASTAACFNTDSMDEISVTHRVLLSIV